MRWRLRGAGCRRWEMAAAGFGRETLGPAAGRWLWGVTSSSSLTSSGGCRSEEAAAWGVGADGRADLKVAALGGSGGRRLGGAGGQEGGGWQWPAGMAATTWI
uniref:Uncharacterized protein n=1 Tax=Leersia perrieri TaxID=77586 RepID=A0A0D9W4F9_9ORYZ